MMMKEQYALAYPLAKDLKALYPDNTVSDHAYLNEDIRDSEFRELNIWINECSLNKAIFEFITNASFLNRLNQEKWN